MSFDPRLETDVDFRLDAPVWNVIGQWKNVHLKSRVYITTSRLQESNFNNDFVQFTPANQKKIMALFTSCMTQLPAVLLLFIYTFLTNTGK